MKALNPAAQKYSGSEKWITSKLRIGLLPLLQSAEQKAPFKQKDDLR